MGGSKSRRGFLPVTKTKTQSKPLASGHRFAFLSVTRVRMAVESARVGHAHDYDRLVLELWTDGRISPDDALTQASAILQHHLDVFVGYDKTPSSLKEVVDKQDEEKTKLKKLLQL